MVNQLGRQQNTKFRKEINIFVCQSLCEGGVPFEVKLRQPNKETPTAMMEAERIARDSAGKDYNDLDEIGFSSAVSRMMCWC